MPVGSRQIKTAARFAAEFHSFGEMEKDPQRIAFPPGFPEHRTGGQDVFPAVNIMQSGCRQTDPHVFLVLGMNVQFFAGKSIETPLPELKIADVALPLDDTGAELSLAPRIDSGSRGVSVLAAAVIAVAVILVSLAVWFLLARKKRREARERAVPVWERAIEAIRELRALVRTGQASPELAIADLTDVVRRYLEARFQLRAERQTTAEFLADLERNDSLLDEKDRKFLRSFLASADMVKFARLPADPGLFDKASVKAEELITGTIPDPDAVLASNPGGRK